MQHRQVTYSSKPNHRARVVHAQGERQFRTYDTSHIRPRKSKGPVIFAVILALVVIAALCFGAFTVVKGCSHSVNGSESVVSADTRVVIPEGTTATDMADILEQNGVIPDAKSFLKRASELGLDSKFKAGTYSFTAGMTLDQVMGSLVTGPAAEGNLTIPEGYTVEQIAVAVEEASGGTISKQDFLDAAHNAPAYESAYPFVKGAYNGSLEGFLFPKTYNITKTDTADTVIRMMLDQYKVETSSMDLSYDQLIIASMIEREAQLDEERPLVASVIYNRLDANMPLGIDATTAYVFGTDFTPDQLHEPGPYNTYDQTGLPAGPICSPGASSLAAAAHPDKTDYLYYVTSGKDDGSHVFSKTYEEHQSNIANVQ